MRWVEFIGVLGGKVGYFLIGGNHGEVGEKMKKLVTGLGFLFDLVCNLWREMRSMV